MGTSPLRLRVSVNSNGNTSIAGNKPFDYIGYGNTGKKLSAIVKCYNPAGSNSHERYDWITKHFSNVVEQAVQIRKNN
ncbi:MAG: hypothetical protein ACRD9S_24650 [Pyrinomonadaceae bacterium]